MVFVTQPAFIFGGQQDFVAELPAWGAALLSAICSGAVNIVIRSERRGGEEEVEEVVVVVVVIERDGFAD